MNKLHIYFKYNKTDAFHSRYLKIVEYQDI